MMVEEATAKHSVLHVAVHPVAVWCLNLKTERQAILCALNWWPQSIDCYARIARWSSMSREAPLTVHQLIPRLGCAMLDVTVNLTYDRRRPGGLWSLMSCHVKTGSILLRPRRRIANMQLMGFRPIRGNTHIRNTHLCVSEQTNRRTSWKYVFLARLKERVDALGLEPVHCSVRAHGVALLPLQLELCLARPKPQPVHAVAMEDLHLEETLLGAAGAVGTACWLATSGEKKGGTSSSAACARPSRSSSSPSVNDAPPARVAMVKEPVEELCDRPCVCIFRSPRECSLLLVSDKIL
eukprot:6194270-Pleurochrysis_carterae.AAC.3